MAIVTRGESAKKVLAEAAATLSGNAYRYATGAADWGLRDLAGNAKKFSGSYLRARNTAEAAIKKECRRRRQVFQRVDGAGKWHMEVRPAGVLEKAMKLVEGREIENWSDLETRERYPHIIAWPTVLEIRSVLSRDSGVRFVMDGECVRAILLTDEADGSTSKYPKTLPNRNLTRLIDCLS